MTKTIDDLKQLEHFSDHPWIKEDGDAPDTPLDNVVLDRMKQFVAMNQFKKAALRVGTWTDMNNTSSGD